MSREARSRKRSIQAEEGTAYAKAQGWLLTADTAFSPSVVLNTCHRATQPAEVTRRLCWWGIWESVCYSWAEGPCRGGAKVISVAETRDREAVEGGTSPGMVLAAGGAQQVKRLPSKCEDRSSDP